MKIIKPGCLPKNRGTCNYCGCEFEYDSNDVYTAPTLTTTWGSAYVICPYCGRTVYLYNYYKQIDYTQPWVTYTSTGETTTHMDYNCKGDTCCDGKCKKEE